MRYLLIDRIQQLERNKQIQAIKCVALSEDVFTEHFFGSPAMPGALLIECLAQAGTALLEVSTNLRRKALLVMVNEAKFRRLVRPGDQLSIALNIISSNDNSALMDGTIHIVDQLVMTAKITFALEEVEQYYPQKVRHLVETVYNVWLKDAKMVGFSDREVNT